jgi:hypothetical protein
VDMEVMGVMKGGILPRMPGKVPFSLSSAFSMLELWFVGRFEIAQVNHQDYLTTM